MIVERNEDGSFVTTLVSVNSRNRHSVLIPREVVKEQMKRWNIGGMRSQLGCPIRRPGEAEDDFKARCITIEIERVCCELRQFRIAEVEDKSQLTATVFPLGTPCGVIFSKMVDESPEAWRFGMRAFTSVKYRDGVPEMSLDQIITFDVIANL